MEMVFPLLSGILQVYIPFPPEGNVLALFKRRISPGRLCAYFRVTYGSLLSGLCDILIVGVMNSPTLELLEFEMQSNLTPLLALTIRPLLAMSPVDTLASDRITCIPAPTGISPIILNC